MSFRLLLRSRAALTFCLVVALLWAPIWGQWHGIAHQVQQVAAVSPAASADPEEAHGLGSTLCQVLDHLAHASGLPSWPSAQMLVVLPAASLAVRESSTHSTAPWWPKRARAPPVRI